MNKLLIGLATVPLMSSVAFAAQPLTDRQMDAVTAGFTAFSTSLAESFGGVTSTATANLAEVSALRDPVTGLPVTTPATVTVNGSTVPVEVQLNVIKSVSAAQSISTAANLPALQNPGGLLSGP